MAVLTEAYEAALLGDDDALCAFASSSYNCEQSLIGVPAAPTTPPTVACTWEFDPEGDFQPGRALHITGVDGDGNEYDSVLLALDLQEGIRLIDAVFWNNTALSQGALNEPAVVPPC